MQCASKTPKTMVFALYYSLSADIVLAYIKSEQNTIYSGGQERFKDNCEWLVLHCCAFVGQGSS